jgi:prepilin-type N-terminal cleavage/methylation domain-containing protein
LAIATGLRQIPTLKREDSMPDRSRFCFVHSVVRHSGFTLVELIMVIVLVGVLAVAAVPRMFDLSMWRLRAFADDMQSTTAAMQRRALAQRRPIRASFSTTGVTYDFVPVPASGARPAPPVSCPQAVPVCLADASVGSVTFNALNAGHAVALPAPLRLDVTDGTTVLYRFQLENDTGLMWRMP